MVTIGTPVEPFGAVEKWTQIVPLVLMYGAFGPKSVDRILTKALLGSDAVASQPIQARVTMDEFRQADRQAKLRAMRCLMVRRRSLSGQVSQISCPTLLLVPEGGQEGWTPAESAAVARRMKNAALETLPGAGNMAPLLLAAGLIAERLRTFWG